MKFKIVFSAAEKESRHEAAARFVISRKPKPTRSLVLIHFPARNMTLSYYNNQFDLHCGDLVFVEGKLEGFRGHVVDVCYTFKIKLSDYKRVISVADTKVHGEFHLPDRTSSPLIAARSPMNRSSPGSRHLRRRIRRLFPNRTAAAFS